MTLGARKSTKRGEGPKNVFVAFAPVPVVVANFFFLICLLRLFAKERGEKGKDFYPFEGFGLKGSFVF